MSEFNKPGFSGSPPKHPGRIRIPPRTLPGQLDESCPFSFDQRNVANIPFSPTSPGKRSPGRPRTMKEYEDEITSLKKENFNLKVRIFFIEQNRMDLNLPKDVEELRLRLTDLTVDIESKKKELSDTEDLLLKSYKVVDTQKKQLEAIKSDQETEKQTLQNKIDSLEKELKDWQMKFMETSVHLDDTNALYAMTFGVNNKQGMEKEDDFSEKIKYLENELEKEKEKVMVLEGENTQLKSKLVKDQDELRKLQNFVEEIKVDLDKLLKERNLFEGSANEATSKLAAVEKLIKMKSDELKQKENEIEHLKYIIKDQEKKIADATKQEEKPALDPQRKLMKLLKIENIHLKEQVKEFQKRSECRSFRNGSKSSRELPTSPGWSDHEQELCTKLNESELMREELLKEIAYLKSVHDNGQTLIQTLIRENKTLKRNFESAKTTSGSQMNPSKEEVTRKK